MICTYRLQLKPGFDFDKAATVANYLAELGVSHVYASPYLRARAGSDHGYDVVDHTEVNPDLGGEKGRDWFCRALGEQGLSHILDVVPNHMAIGTAENAWWWDVLENGPSSRFASFFDVDWDYSPGAGAHDNRVLLPVLGDHFGRILDRGELRIERRGAAFIFRYYDSIFPLAPRSCAAFLGQAGNAAESDELRFLAVSLVALPGPHRTDRPAVERRHRDKSVILTYLAELLDTRPTARRALDDEIDAINASADRLDEIHARQNYRLAHWRLAGSDLGYRRFFDINSLIGLRMEDEVVFRATHTRVLEWLKDQSLAGIRIDHVDGLRDPLRYLRRIKEAAPGALVYVEKILEADEPLREEWPVEGTTGYEFLTAVDRFFVKASAEDRFSRFYSYFTGEHRMYEEIVAECKRQVLNDLLASDVNRLVGQFRRMCEADRRLRDFDRETITTALVEVLAGYPVYRSYVDSGPYNEPNELDKAIITVAVRSAQAANPEIDSEIFDALALYLSRMHEEAYTAEPEIAEDFALRAQQLSAPVTAKGAEDTALYVYNRFVALNEVGGNPATFGSSIEAFGTFLAERNRSMPRGLNAASTHDTKRGEDTRHRLTTISEVPDRWEEFVNNLSVICDPFRSGNVPDRNIEYLFYQNLVGAWPISSKRMVGAIQKSMREAKVHTSWTNTNKEYEDGVVRFVEGAMESSEVQQLVQDFVDIVALPGWQRSLAACVLRVTAPGIPDVYQGSELWNHSLVDPDNRGIPDFALRQELLKRVGAAIKDENYESMYEEWEIGLPKLFVLHRSLATRNAYPEAFDPATDGTPAALEMLDIRGEHRRNYFGFLRGGNVATILRRFHVYPQSNAAVELPKGAWRDVLSGNVIDGGTNKLSQILGPDRPDRPDRSNDKPSLRPAALLVRGEPGGRHDADGRHETAARDHAE